LPERYVNPIRLPYRLSGLFFWESPYSSPSLLEHRLSGVTIVSGTNDIDLVPMGALDNSYVHLFIRSICKMVEPLADISGRYTRTRNNSAIFVEINNPNVSLLVSIP